MELSPPHPLAGVRTRRQLLGISAADIAKRIAIAPTSYMRLERGERRIYFDKAKAIAKMLQCSCDDLEREPSAEEAQVLYAKRVEAANDPERVWDVALARAKALDEQHAQKVGIVVLQNDVNKQIDDDEPETEEEYVYRMIHGDL